MLSPQPSQFPINGQADTPRHVRKDLHDLEREVQRYKREPLDQIAYRAGVRDIHSDTVAQVVNNYRMNVLIGAHPPSVAAEEENLPRATRVVLAQLRSGYCSRLNSFWSRIDGRTANTCPACGLGPHDTQHLFNCTAKPTSLTPMSLWTQPVLVADFINLELGNAEVDADDATDSTS